MAMLYAIALAVPAPHAPAALTGQEANTTRLAVPTSRAYGWSLDARVYEKPGVFTGCPDNQRNAAEDECFAAVHEATHIPVLSLRNHVKVVDVGADGYIPSGCSFSRAHGKRAIFNKNTAGRSSAGYPLVCVEDGTRKEPMIMHIAKTGVDSLCEELKVEGIFAAPEKETCFGSAGQHVKEDCLAQLPASDFTMTLVRNPREHVVSQYTQCRFIGLHPRTPGSNGSDGGEFSEACFEEWLRDATVSDDALGCYHPFNMQSRHFTCHKRPHLLHNWEPGSSRVPDVNAALHALARLEFVGVTDLYDESWCAMQTALGGALPADCTCSKIGQDPFRAFSKELWHTGEVYERHGLKAHPSSSEMSPAVIELIDGATTVDRILYTNATARFLGELCALQRSSGTQLLCPERMDMLRNATQYIDGLWAAVDSAANECLEQR